MKLGKRKWIALLLFGLFGQFAWTIENMYLNVFVYNTISSDPNVIAWMVAASAISATLTTLFMGVLSDKLGKRKVFIVIGYLLWGISTASFGMVSLESIQSWFPTVNAAVLGATIVILLDCIMTFFGSTANDAAFNAYVTDITIEENRGRVESVLAILPLISMLIIFGGFDWMATSGMWNVFFIGFGIAVSVVGILGVFLIEEPSDLKPNSHSLFKNSLEGLKPSVIKSLPKLYMAFVCIMVYGISTQIFMPYLIIYIQKYLMIENYAIILGIVLSVASIITVLFGKLIDMFGKKNLLIPAVVINFIGLIGMYYASDFSWVIVVGIIMLSGNMIVNACVNGMIRDATPQDQVGHFQGIRMLFAVLVPMICGPFIGARVITNSNLTYLDLGIVKQVPSPNIFLASAMVLILLLIPFYFLKKEKKKITHLMSDQGALLDKNHVLEEHPNPYMERKNYQSLNGVWQFECSKNKPFEYSKEIVVPFACETLLSGLNIGPDEQDILWYKTTFKVNFDTPVVFLHFEAVDQACVVSLNGHVVGEHQGGYTAFSFEITHLLKEENVLEVKVIDLGSKSIMGFGKQSKKSGGIWYKATSGIVQSVWLEGRGQIYLDKLTIVPDIDTNSVLFSPEFNQDCEYVLRILDRDSCIYEQSHYQKAQVEMKDYHYWSAEDPFLYHYQIKTIDDQVDGIFGMRNYTLEADSKGIMRMCVNHQPVLMKGLLDQGYTSDGYYTYASDQMIIDELVRIKALGYNMLRKHIKVESKRWYYWCDQLGIYVAQDMVSGGEQPYNPLIIQILPFLNIHLKDHHYGLFGRKDELARKQFLVETMETIEQLRNIPCICMWVPFNEGWGQFDSHAIAERIKQMDSTRFVDETSGWHDQQKGDFESIHVYFKSIKVKQSKRCLFISEFGGYSVHVPQHSYSSVAFGYKQFKTIEQFQTAYLELMRKEILPSLTYASGFIYTQVSDVEEEVNGLFTFDRKIDKSNEAFLTMNQELDQHFKQLI